MMTFGLNRPVFAFGLMVGAALIVTDGECRLTADDARVLTAEHLGLSVSDVRIVKPSDFDKVMRDYELRTFFVRDFRTFDVYNEGDDLDDTRTFIEDEERIFIAKRDCDGSDDSLI